MDTLQKILQKKLKQKILMFTELAEVNGKKRLQKWGYLDQINGNLTKNLSKYNLKFDFVIHCAGSGLVGLKKKGRFY